MTETDFKKMLRFFLAAQGVYSATVEAGFGGRVGMCDLLVQAGPDRKLLRPIETKIGEVRNGLLFPRKIRPGQIQFMDELQRAGVACRLVVGVQAGKVWDGYAFSDCSLKALQGWKTGFPLWRSLKVVDGGEDVGCLTLVS